MIRAITDLPWRTFGWILIGGAVGFVAGWCACAVMALKVGPPQRPQWDRRAG